MRGDRGGVKKSSVDVTKGFGERLAPGLNEKDGSSGEASGLVSVIPPISTADLGRRPAALGVDADIGLDGKENGGFGGGPSADTETSVCTKDSFKSIILPNGSERWRGLCKRPPLDMSGTTTAAICAEAALRTEADD